MNKNFLTGFFIFAICGILLSIFLFAYSINNKMQLGAKDAEETFSILIYEIFEMGQIQDFNIEDFKNRLIAVCENIEIINECTIFTNDQQLFSWKSERFNLNPTLFSKSYSSSIDIGKNTVFPVVVSCIIHVLHPEHIFNASRNSFFIILIVLFSSLFILFVLPNRNLLKEKKSKTQFNQESLTKTLQKSSEILDASILTKQNTLANTAIDDSIVDNSSTNKSKTENQEPLGLYTPTTGLGWEQYLEERLSGELERAVSLEQDLSLFIIKITGLIHTDLLARKISELLLDMFKFNDLIFEYDKNGFVVILHDTNLNSAMNLAEDLFLAIKSILHIEESSSSIAIGITNRAARLLTASRMIEEARNAAQKALEEDTLPIVAYRSNPEKHRELINQSYR